MLSKEKIEERKIIPIAAMISAGKSKLLNVIFNNDFLECKAGIGTKFVNILRYNPNIQKPIFYHLNVEVENGKFVFYKDPNSEVKEGEKDIIEENKNINSKLADSSSTFKYEDIFYMTEINKVEFIEDKHFLLSHDFCDIPGLSEYQKTSEDITPAREEKETPKEQQIEENLIESARRQFGIIYKSEETVDLHSKKNKEIQEINKEKILEEENEEEKDNEKEDDIFYHVDEGKEKTYLKEIFTILREYIDGAIIVLSVENFYFEENFVIITKLRKVIQKEINNFLVILNKMDLSNNPKKDIDKCKGLFMQKFPNCKTFNLNLNTFIPLSAIQLQNEFLMKTSFPHLIKYHFYNYLLNVKKERQTANEHNDISFISHLRNIIENSKIMKKQEIEKKLKDLNNLENISEIESDFINIIKEIKDNFCTEHLNFGISEEDFKIENKNDEDDDDIFNTDGDEEKGQKNDYDFSSFNACDIIKIMYIFHKEKMLIPSISKEANDLLNYFKEKKREDKNFEEKKEKIKILKMK